MLYSLRRSVECVFRAKNLRDTDAHSLLSRCTLPCFPVVSPSLTVPCEALYRLRLVSLALAMPIWKVLFTRIARASER